MIPIEAGEEVGIITEATVEVPRDRSLAVEAQAQKAIQVKSEDGEVA